MGASASGHEHTGETIPLTGTRIPDIADEHASDDSSSSSTDTPDITKRTCAYICVLFARLQHCCGLALAQVLNRSIPHSQLNGFRYSVQLIIATFVIICIKRCDVKVAKSHIPWVCLGAVMLLASTYTSYGAPYYLPLGVATGTFHCFTLITVCILTVIIHGTIPKTHLLATAICIIGIMLILQPSLIFPDTLPSLLVNNNTFYSPCGTFKGSKVVPINNTIRSDTVSPNVSYTTYTTVNNDIHIGGDHHRTRSDNVIGYTFVVINSLATAGHLQILRYKVHELDSFVYMFWTSIFGFVTSFCLMGAFETPALPVVQVCIIVMLTHMLFSGSHTFFFVHGTQILPTTVTSLIGSMMIPLMFILQYTALSDMYPGHANILEVSGALFVFIGSIVVPAQEFFPVCLK